MGTWMAPSYANLLMGKFKQQFLQTKNKLPLVWWRYIDHRNYVTFLGTWVYVKDGRVEKNLHVHIHVKLTSKHQYLHTKSAILNIVSLLFVYTIQSSTQDQEN